MQFCRSFGVLYVLDRRLRRLLGLNAVNGRLLQGTAWEIGLKRFLPEASRQPLQLKVLPLRKDASVYLPKDAWPKFDFTNAVSDIESITALPEYEIRISEIPKRATTHEISSAQP